MLASDLHLKETATLLSENFLVNYPLKAAREFANLPTEEVAAVLQDQPMSVVVPIFRQFPIGAAESVVVHWPLERVVDLLLALDVHQATGLLARSEEEFSKNILAQLSQRNKAVATELEDLLTYPERTAGRMMETRVQVFSDNLRAEEVMDQIKIRAKAGIDYLFVVDSKQQILGYIKLADLVLADGKQKITGLVKPIATFINAMDPEEDVVEKFEGAKQPLLPVLDANDHLIGVIRALSVYQFTKEDLASDMASMVGASRDEKSLSSSWFAVKKRMPWLQINLLTAFAAAAVVGAFEGIISQFTALAILLPVAAGQSGNAGAQALAVTMRGLTLKEITTRHWWRVLRKESAVGFMNGIAIAVTCAIGVYMWSQSFGLALVMILAMIVSLTIACASGALVPIVLKKFGLDPAQSSSIVLTTVTDIAGFMSFLGIATALASTLPKG